MKPFTTEKILDDLIGPICHIAALVPTNEWPRDLQVLIGLARKVKDSLGFQVQVGTDDD